MLNEIYIFEPKFNFMKKLHYFLLCLLTITLFNCSRDDKNEGIQFEYNIEGAWMPTAIALNGTISQNGITQPIKQVIPLGVCERQTKVIFNADKTGHITAYSGENGSCEIKQEKNFTYVLNKNTGEVSVNIDNVITKSRIISATSNQTTSEEVVYNQNIGGFIFTGIATTTYQRVK